MSAIQLTFDIDSRPEVRAEIAAAFVNLRQIMHRHKAKWTVSVITPAGDVIGVEQDELSREDM